MVRVGGREGGACWVEEGEVNPRGVCHRAWVVEVVEVVAWRVGCRWPSGSRFFVEVRE